jgi:hypothetical protein
MTMEELFALRTFWNQCQNLTCQHSVLIGLRTDDGRLSGSYVCTRCGNEVFRKTDADDHHSGPSV